MPERHTEVRLKLLKSFTKLYKLYKAKQSNPTAKVRLVSPKNPKQGPSEKYKINKTTYKNVQEREEDKDFEARKKKPVNNRAVREGTQFLSYVNYACFARGLPK